MILVDSSGWIEYFVDGPLAGRYAAHIEGTQEVLVPTIVLYEVYKKITRDAGERPAIDAIANMKKGITVPLSERLALAASAYSLQHKLPMADAIIYATAQAERAKVITSDEHFKGLPGVEFIERG